MKHFVVAGIGAIRGIDKCFISHGHSYEDAIRYTKEHFTELQKKYGYIEFRPLKGHEPTLLDLQNCFCETDKFLRAKMPELLVGNKRIKQNISLRVIRYNISSLLNGKLRKQISYVHSRI